MGSRVAGTPEPDQATAPGGTAGRQVDLRVWPTERELLADWALGEAHPRRLMGGLLDLSGAPERPGLHSGGWKPL